MSLLEEDLRLTEDDHPETPLPMPLTYIRRDSTPVYAFVEANFSYPCQIAGFTPTNIVTPIGSGKSNLLLSYVSDFLAFDEATHEVFESPRLSVEAWWRTGTPTNPRPSNRARSYFILRKLRAAAGHRQESSGLRAMRDVCEWLQITRAEAIAITGVNERTYYHWQAHPAVQPRLRSVEHLSRVHAFLELLIAEHGDTWVRGWTREGSPTRLERLRDPAQLLAIENEALALAAEAAMRQVMSVRSMPVRVTAEEDAELFAARERELADPVELIVISREADRE